VQGKKGTFKIKFPLVSEMHPLVVPEIKISACGMGCPVEESQIVPVITELFCAIEKPVQRNMKIKNSKKISILLFWIVCRCSKEIKKVRFSSIQ